MENKIKEVEETYNKQDWTGYKEIPIFWDLIEIHILITFLYASADGLETKAFTLNQKEYKEWKQRQK